MKSARLRGSEAPCDRAERGVFAHARPVANDLEGAGSADARGALALRSRRPLMFAHFLAVALSFPSVVYTVLLGIALVYWVFVMIGAAHLDLLGDGVADGAGDGALDGIDGGHGDGAGHGDAADAGDADGGHADGDGGDAHGGALSGLLASLKLRSAPATVVLSVLFLFSWLLSVLGMQAAAANLPADALSLARFGIFLLAPLLSLPLTSIVVRPMARIFVPPVTTAKQDLVGKVCTVRTGTVTDRFGEGLLEDGGAGLVVRIRVDAGESVKRGDQVVILGYDDERQEFTVAPMEGLMDEREDERKAARRSE